MCVCLKTIINIRTLTKNIKYLSAQYCLRSSKLFYCSLVTSNGFPQNDQNFEIIKKTKILKVAIIGVPNAGKSTLINRIIERHVFPVSKKVHTTRSCARAVMIMDDTQIVFLDTPGLVSVKESKKHHLEHSCLADSELAVVEADVIGVIHDVSNKFTKFSLDQKVLRLLYLYPQKPSFLILNKVDIMKSKRELLDCADILTKRGSKDDLITERLSEIEIQGLLSGEVGWSHFKDVFMISALTGSGVGDIKFYLLNLAKPGDWVFEKTVVTDTEQHKVVENIVFSKLLDYLPNIVPYELKVELEYFNITPEGFVTAIILIICNKPRIQGLVKGRKGERIKGIAKDIEQDLRQFFLNDVRVKLVLTNAEEYKRNVKLLEINV